MLQVIYIPGLGDHRIKLQRFVVGLWRFRGVQPHVFRMQWSNKRPYAQKFDDLLATIDTLSKEGRVALVGSSAGASAALNAYAVKADQIVAVVCIAGKINNPQTILDAYKKQAPSFYESAQLVPEALKAITPEMRQRILSVRSAADEIIPAGDSIIEGAHNRAVWTRGHAFTIAGQLLFGAPRLLRFVKHSVDQSA